MTRPFRSLAFITLAAVASPWPALGQMSVTELNTANAVRNEMMANDAGTAAPAAPAGGPPPSSPATQARPESAMKYTLSYALVGMLIGLGMYIVCRPSNRYAGD
jgi:hypothetical protein